MQTSDCIIRPCLVPRRQRVSAENAKKSRRTVRVRRALDGRALREPQKNELRDEKSQTQHPSRVRLIVVARWPIVETNRALDL